MTYLTKNIALCMLAIPLVLAAQTSLAKKTTKPNLTPPETPAVEPKTLANLTAEQQAKLTALIEKTKKNMILVQGGSYEMGDWGFKYGPEHLSYSSDEGNKPLHKVTLDSFRINAYKSTYADFDVMSEVTGTPKVSMQPDTLPRRIPTAAAGINWQTARNYCHWLGTQVGTAMDLPTEAQWEYAARNRGQLALYPTDNGKIDSGRNVASYKQWLEIRSKYNLGVGGSAPLGMYPPTPLGLYDMINNGFEWMRDWFSPTYYEHSPELNPTGSATGTEKVVRSNQEGQSGEELEQSGGGLTFSKWYKKPNVPYPKKFGWSSR